jgi:hypothetical protein
MIPSHVFIPHTHDRNPTLGVGFSQKMEVLKVKSDIPGSQLILLESAAVQSPVGNLVRDLLPWWTLAFYSILHSLFRC